MPDPSLQHPALFSLAWWDEFAPLVQAGMVLVTGFVAVRGLNVWRAQLVGKRKAELAEEVLTAFYEARDTFVWARSRGMFGSEGESRTPLSGETDALRQARNLYFVPIERLTRAKDLFAKIHARRYAFRAYFGEEAAKPFEKLADVHNQIMSSASVLIQSVMPGTNEAVVLLGADELLDTLGWGKRERPDPIDQSIDEAISRMESVCKPVLEGKRS
jgi:hypothetical protein